MWASLIGAAGSIFGGFANNYAAKKRAEQDRLQNFMYGEQAANAADERFRKQYLDLFSPSAQMKQLKEAGLSPALAYGNMSGSGGATAPQGGGAGGVQTPYFPTTALDMATLQNIMAQTKKTEAEEDNVKQDTVLKQQQTTQQELFNFITESKAEFDIKQAEELANMYRTQAELTATKNKRENIFLQYDDEKTQAEIAEMKERTNNIIADTGLKLAQEKLAGSQIELNEMQENALAQQITASIQQTRQKWTELGIQSKSQEAQQAWFEEQAKNLTNMYNAKCEELKISQAKLDNEDSRAYERLIVDMYLGDKESFSKSFGSPYASVSGSKSGISKDAKKGLKNFQFRKPNK